MNKRSHFVTQKHKYSNRPAAGQKSVSGGRARDMKPDGNAFKRFRRYSVLPG
jgi:hypothetical protein